MRLENFIQVPITNSDSIPKAQKGFANIFINSKDALCYGKDSTGRLLPIGGPVVKTKRVLYTWTAQNVIDGFAAIPVVFDTPFADNNYTVVWSPNDQLITETLDYYNGDIHDKDADGFDAVAYAFSPGPGYSTAGDKLIINAIAIHD